MIAWRLCVGKVTIYWDSGWFRPWVGCMVSKYGWRNALVWVYRLHIGWELQ